MPIPQQLHSVIAASPQQRGELVVACITDAHHFSASTRKAIAVPLLPVARNACSLSPFSILSLSGEFCIQAGMSDLLIPTRCVFINIQERLELSSPSATQWSVWRLATAGSITVVGLPWRFYEYLDGIVCGIAHCVGLRFHSLPRGRSPDPPVADFRGDFPHSSLRDGSEDSLTEPLFADPPVESAFSSSGDDVKILTREWPLRHSQIEFIGE
jgi:hypothetical protein